VEGTQKFVFGNVRSYSLLTTFFELMNEEKGLINSQKQIYGKCFGKMSIFQKF